MPGHHTVLSEVEKMNTFAILWKYSIAVTILKPENFPYLLKTLPPDISDLLTYEVDSIFFAQ